MYSTIIPKGKNDEPNSLLYYVFFYAILALFW